MSGEDGSAPRGKWMEFEVFFFFKKEVFFSILLLGRERALLG